MAEGPLSGKAIGVAVERLDGAAKVTGGARYTADFDLPGMLFGKCLRSPYANARILSIDTRRARALPGVHAVLTAVDVPDQRWGRYCKDIPILPQDHVRFIGEKVAAVAAESGEIAEAALDLIEVEYDERPAVFDAIEAMREGAPLVHEGPAELAQGGWDQGLHGTLRMYPPVPNVISELRVERGNIEGAFASGRAFQHDFFVPAVHQGYLEPHSCMVAVAEDGAVDIWASNKSPHLARLQMAELTGLPPDRVRFNTVMIGGDFGGKGSLMDTALCFHLAKRARRPVRMVMTYLEELTAANPRHSASITLRTAVDGRGGILAMDARLVFNAGAYAGFIPLPTVHGYIGFAGPYRVPSCRLDVYRVHTNTVPAGHMRSPGGPQITFAVESHLDIIAHELGIEPLEFRRRNAIADGDPSPLGEVRQGVRCREILDEGERAFGWDGPKAPGVGRGVGLYEYPPGTFGRSVVALSIGADGTIAVSIGAPETGTGFHTITRQLVAEHFKVPAGEVNVVFGDTQSSGFDSGASGSRLTTTVGEAVDRAAREIKDRLVVLAAERLNCAPSEIETTADGAFATDGQRITLKALMEWTGLHGLAPVTGRGENTPGSVYTGAVTSFAAQFAEVEVDRDTGAVNVRRVVTAHDVGTIVNPVTHQGQIEGGLVQVLGQALSEQLVIQDGLVMTPHLGEYKLPTIMDVPELETVLVPGGAGLGPYGIKAIGEMGNGALPAAIANAVYDAVGVRLLDLPVTAEKIHMALKRRKTST